MKRLEPKKTAVIVIDVQERLCQAMPGEQLDAVVRSARILTEAARLFAAPVLFTEQYPKGLGATTPEVQSALGAAGAQRFEKTSFSACDAPGFVEALEVCGAPAAVVIGMESHVCVFQTVRDLTRRGIEVHVPIDGVSSRRDDHRLVGLSLCERAGAVRTTTESVVFDWLERAGTEQFKRLSALIR